MEYNDIYFTEKYGKLYERIENGKLEVFEYRSDFGCISNMFIMKEIPIVIGQEKLYDIRTPYGYGGPIIRDCIDANKKSELVQGYHNAFRDYCKGHKIVSEFARFHPINKNGDDFRAVYNIECVRKTVGTNLKDYDDPVQDEFKKGCKKEIRQALNKGLTYELIKSPDSIKIFKKIYWQTLDRNNSDDFYYFDDKYFEDILKNLKDEILIINLLYRDNIIASELYFVSGRLMHAHLSGCLTEYINLPTGCLVEYAAVLWGKKNGFDYIHHGGGRTNDENDPLLLHKRKYGKNTEFDFCVGKKIWDQDKYDELCEISGLDGESDFFPAYRSNL